MTYTVTAVFEFADKTTERIPLFTGSKHDCEQLDRRIGNDTALGLAGIRYDGARKEVPVQVVTVVHQTEETPSE